MRSKILAALSALAIALGMVAFTTTSASAHHNSITASVSCNANYQWEVTWSVTNSENDKAEKIIFSSNTDVIPINTEFTAGQTRTFTQIVSEKTKLTLTITGEWTNGVKTENTGTLKKDAFKDDCKPPAAQDATASATPTPASCTSAGGVTFSILNAKWENDTDLTDGSRKAVADAGHVFPGGATTLDVTYQIPPKLTGSQCKPTCITAVWSMPSWINSTTPSWPQTLYTSFKAPCGNLTWTPPEGCGLQFQIDSYYDNDITKAILDSGVLNKNNNPKEQLVPGGWGTAYKLVKSATNCATAPAATMIPATCTAPGLLSLSGEHVTFTVVQGNDPKGTFAGIAPGNYTVYNTWGDASSGPYYGPVTVTAQLDSGYSLSGVGEFVPLTVNTAAPTTLKLDTAGSLGPWNLISAAPQDCPTVIDIVPEVTFTDVCGTTNDKINVPTQTGVTYTTTVDTRVNGVGDVTVTATPSSTAYVFASTVTTTSWSFTFTNTSCGEIKYIDPDAFDPTCPTEPNATSGYIQLDQKLHLHYTINGTATTLLKNNRPPGTYTIGVTVDQGYTLNGLSSWQLVINPPFCPPTLALLSTTASMSNLTCSTSGSYTLADTEGIEWFVNGSTTATPAGTYARSTPGVVNVEAKLVDPVNDGWELDAQKAWTFTFTTPIDCLPTLAFTGSNGGNLGLLLSGGLLLFGGTIIAFERRFRSQTR